MKLGTDSSGFVTAAFEQVLARAPTEAELIECLSYLRQGAGWASPGIAQSDIVEDSDVNVPSSDPVLRRRESLVHVLLNHHDFVTIR
jgi:hypothetical protein